MGSLYTITQANIWLRLDLKSIINQVKKKGSYLMS